MLAPRKTLHSTPLCVFRRALELVNASPHDVLYDLGCGDGRLVVAAAKEFGLRAVGVEIDAQRAQLAASKAAKAGVDHLVTIHCANALEFDVPRDATIVFLFLIDRGLR
jgi:cyclopropane fatty-acyl-phospholipid synthase-like methyltransferase